MIDKRRRRTRRATINGGVQGAMLAAMQAGILGAALLLWSRGQASIGGITFALTMFFMLAGRLRDVGMHIRNLQRSVNDMEELVALERQPLGVDDRPDANEMRVTAGESRFEDVTFRYGQHEASLYEHFSTRIAPGERVGLVGHSGSGKTAFIKLIQRLYDVRTLDRLLVMAHGRIIEQGSHGQLIRRKGGLYRRLFERQALELTQGLTSAEMLADGASSQPVRKHGEDPDPDEACFAFDPPRDEA